MMVSIAQKHTVGGWGGVGWVGVGYSMVSVGLRGLGLSTKKPPGGGVIVFCFERAFLTYIRQAYL